MAKPPAFTNTRVLIIGGGISGMAMAIELITRYSIREIVIIEKSGGFGGTWRDNVYPGAACDVFSSLYSYSFAQKFDFTRTLPGQEEILTYLTDVAQEYKLYQHARFNSSVRKMEWNDDQLKWYTTVTIDGGKDSEYSTSYEVVSDYVISAIGQLCKPKGFDIPGLAGFEGRVMHTARWDRGLDLTGKKVAIVGTGATSAQVVPEIAPITKHLTVCQRNPGFVIPRHDNELSPWQRWLRANVPLVRKRIRAENMNFRELFHQAVTQADSKYADLMRQMNNGLLEKQLSDRPDLQEKVKPRYNPGCKRTVITNDYYPTLKRPNVDLETSEIEKLTKNGIKFQGIDEVRDIDVLILATGFDTFNFLGDLHIVGREGQTLDQIWPNGVAKALKGIAIPEIPNFGMLYGPNTNLSHNSLILVIEAQARCLAAMINRVFTVRRNAGNGTLAVWPKKEVTERHWEKLQDRLQNTSFSDPACSSWWKRHDGIIVNNWPGTAIDYQRLLEEIKWQDFDATGSAKSAFNSEVSKSGSQTVPRVMEEAWLSRSSLLAIVLGGLAAGVTLHRMWRLQCM
ncbi:hypothetical protein LTR64_004639 [Lithohypha guttulata]|uniref:uncharacterized protein n=1 Tax=Lithohypha guttulata TaxID=1690604 RepID=UPI002DE1C9FB|nr:hypothetical protein LTR51_006063 [Lithohypha guttulata]